MILLEVNECYAFDYLSILEVKKIVNPDSGCKPWEECYSHLRGQLPLMFDTVIKSKEYCSLYTANFETFKAVGIARDGGKVTAKEVDECNLIRYNCKVALQDRFFPNSYLREVKL